ncbi:heterokaryon incompatibility protein-domain-containing protein [Apiospora arundinis]|uniref:Heterokaryon incompatibility protein-domain-containing protein n=1 Tax=Apiospora arundinis TaxID=335852 RepID=A0ABR2JNZ8_9PEZI
MVETFRHIPLQSEDSIRVLDLLPSSRRDAPVQCHIRQVGLSQARDNYEALSYVWGDPKGSRPVLCDGRQLLVTPNCHDAMVRLRRRFRVRTLWIDAICIDQSSAEDGTRERNHQVKQMGDIYQHASTVLVWLGMEGLEIPFKYWLLVYAAFVAGAMYTSHIYSSSTAVGAIARFKDKLKDIVKDILWEPSYYLDVNLKKYEDRHRTLTKIGENQWFTRVWTIQECAFSRSCVLVSGTKTMRWLTLCFISNVMKGALNEDSKLYLRSTVTKIQSRRFAQKLAFRGQGGSGQLLDGSTERSLEFLKVVRNLDSKLPHDKVYGVYSIFRKMNVQLPDPDYSEPLEDVIENLTRAFISTLKNLDLITSGLPSTEPQERPSWVPDYLVPERRPDMASHPDSDLVQYPDRSGSIKLFEPAYFRHPYDASSGSTAFVSPERRPGRLVVRGKKIDSLATVLVCATEQSGDCDLAADFPEFIRLCREWCRAWPATANSSEEIASSPFLVWNYKETELIGIFFAWKDAMLYPDCSEAMRREIEAAPSSGTKTDPVDKIIYSLDLKSGYEPGRFMAGFFQRGLNRTANWAFVATSSGLRGRAYHTCREGDELWLLAGSRAPVVLRKAADGYRYIAPAYFYDLREGQLWPENEEELETLTLV